MYDDMVDGPHDGGRPGSNRSRMGDEPPSKQSRAGGKGGGDFLTVQNRDSQVKYSIKNKWVCCF